MPMQLRDRQLRLVRYLTSSAAIFGDGAPTIRDPALQGMNNALLRMEARFSYEKRMDKIAAVFPRTFALLGDKREACLREFVDACPPRSITRIDNARQFHDFLSEQWRQRSSLPAYLGDMAAFEFACARARSNPSPAQNHPQPVSLRRATHVRRQGAIVLVRMRHDIRPLVEQPTPHIEPVPADVRLVIILPASSNELSILELEPAVFDLLAALNDWTDAAVFTTSAKAGALIDELAQSGLLETRG